MVENASDAFEIVSVNNVTWRDVEYESLGAKEREVLETCGGEYKEFMSETSVSVYIIASGWFPFTVKATERTGRFVVKQVVGQVVPRFLNQLRKITGRGRAAMIPERRPETECSSATFRNARFRNGDKGTDDARRRATIDDD